jgi:hypothetical protein
MAIDIVEEGVRYLAVPVGTPARGTALTRILALKGSPGWLVAPPSLKEWRFVGITERDGSAVLYGPWLPGRPLASVLGLPLVETLPFLIRLSRALQLLSERHVALFHIQTDTVRFCDDGSVLFLPSEVMRELRELQPFALNRDTFEPIHNPDLRGEDMVSFALGALLYRGLTGAFPFGGESPEEMHEQMRKLEILSPAQAVPVVPDVVSQTIMAALGRSRQRFPTLEEWAESLGHWQREGILRGLRAPQGGAVGVKAETLRRSSERRFHRRVFWEKNWRTALIIGAAVALVAAGAGSVLKGVLAPRVTRGYAPTKVVETFYSSMNSLDTMTMQACVVGRAGKAEINEVTNLYVISRVSMGYEGRSNIVAANEWDKAGRPPIPAPRTLYGVTGLSIIQEKPEPAPVFLVSYEKWNPVPSGEQAGSNQPAGPRYEGHAVQDRVFLKKDRGDWVIFRIDRLRWAPLPSK